MKSRMLIILLVLALLMPSVNIASGQEPVKVVYWRALTGVACDVQDELAQLFNESQDEVEVEVDEETGQIFVRNLAMCFDAYLGPRQQLGRPVFSRTV